MKLNIKNKKLQLIIAVVIVLFFAIGYLLTRNNKKVADLMQFVPPKPKIANIITDMPEIKILFKENEYNFPKNVPVIKIQSNQALLTEKAKEIASKLGFSQDPRTYNAVSDGTVYIWINENYSLMITPKINKILYSSNTYLPTAIQNTVNKNISEEDFGKTASDFVNSISEYTNPLTHSTITYLKLQDGYESPIKSDDTNFSLVQVNFSSVFSNVPILTLNPDYGMLTIKLLKDGSIYSLEGFLYNFEQSETTIELMNFETFINNKDKAILINLDNNTYNLEDYKNQGLLKSIEITKISLYYLLDGATSLTLSPVFLLEGTATTNGNKEVNAKFYLPAANYPEASPAL